MLVLVLPGLRVWVGGGREAGREDQAALGTVVVRVVLMVLGAVGPVVALWGAGSVEVDSLGLALGGSPVEAVADTGYVVGLSLPLLSPA